MEEVEKDKKTKEKAKRKKIINYAIYALLIFVVVNPKTRIMVQQGLMKIGLFRPNLEQPKANTESNIVASFVKHGEDKPVRTDELKGKVVFINFWATWCPPCRAEMPSIQTLYKKVGNSEDVVFMLVEIDGERKKALKFLEDENLDLPIYYPYDRIPGQWLGNSVPTTIILDKSGNVAARHEGMADYSRKAVVQFMEDLMNE